jgi:methylated-DNA-[protein]-cysteine S-methyltransferase
MGRVLEQQGSCAERRNPGGVTAAFRAYFEGDLAALDPLAVAPSGTDFQRKVWTTLREIPCGSTWSYGQLAARLGNPKAVRAVGLANGANPLGIVLPCHRVIGADGSLTGYGAGIERKRWLLEHEGAPFKGTGVRANSEHRAASPLRPARSALSR